MNYYNFWYILAVLILAVGTLLLRFIDVILDIWLKDARNKPNNKSIRNIVKFISCLLVILAACWACYKGYFVQKNREKTNIYLDIYGSEMRNKILTDNSEVKQELISKCVDPAFRDRALLLYTAALESYKKGDFLKAIDVLDRSVEWAESGNAHILRGMCHLSCNPSQSQKALNDFQEALELGCRQAYLYNAIGVTYRRLGNVKQAERNYLLCLQIDPKESIFHSNYANLLYDNDEIEEALVQYKVVTSLSPDNSNAHCNVGMCFWLLNEYDSVVTRLSSAENKGCRTVGMYADWGSALGFLKRNREALKQFKKGWYIDSTNIILLQRIADYYDNNGDNDSASKYYEYALSIDSQSVASMNNIGVVYSSKGDTMKARALFEKIIKKYPDKIEAYVNLSNLYITEGNIKKAESIVNKALKINNHCAPLFLNAGNLYVDKGDFKRAVEMYQKAHEVDTSNYITHQNLMAVYSKQGIFDKIVKEYYEWEKYHISDPVIYNAVGNEYMKKGKINEALEIYNKAIKADSLNANAHFYIGQIFFSQNKYKKAIYEFSICIGNKPNNDCYNEALRRLSLSYEKLHMNSEALKHWIALSKLETSTTVHQQCINHIKLLTVKE